MAPEQTSLATGNPMMGQQSQYMGSGPNDPYDVNGKLQPKNDVIKFPGTKNHVHEVRTIPAKITL